MPVAHEEQAALWNGVAGQAWVDAQESLDRMFQPFEDLLVEPIPMGSGRRVLDVGCGTGATTLAAAGRLGPSGLAVGVDISEPMIALARRRAARDGSPAVFVRADAEAHGFEPARFDTILSRFGVMFFADPVRAFANLRSATRAGGDLRFVAWRSPSESPFMTAAERAAAPFLPGLPPRPADGPGQFAFADGLRVRAILQASGWARIDVRAIDVECTLPVEDLDAYITRLGPVGRVLWELDPPTRARAVEAMRAAFEPYVQGPRVRYVAACWRVTAQAR